MNTNEIEPYEAYRRAVLHKDWALSQYQNAMGDKQAAEDNLSRCERELESARIRLERTIGGCDVR